MFKKLGVVVFASLLVTTALAQQPPPPSAWARGAGAAAQCNTWLSERGAEIRTGANGLHTSSEIAWMQGYLSGLNVQRNMLEKVELVTLPPPEEMVAMMDRECAGRPKVYLFDIGLILFKFLTVK